jgi:hypothetical protein
MTGGYGGTFQKVPERAWFAPWGGIPRERRIKVGNMVPACCKQSRWDHRGHALSQAPVVDENGRALASATRQREENE